NIVFTDQAWRGPRRGRRGPPCRRRKLVSVFCEQLPSRPTHASKRTAPGHGGNVHVAAHLTTVCLCAALCRANGSSDRSYWNPCRSRRQFEESHPPVW